MDHVETVSQAGPMNAFGIDDTSGHNFKKGNKTYCNHCGKGGATLICEDCNFACHENCKISVITPCRTTEENALICPVEHRWLLVKNEKRNFCNYCRGSLGNGEMVYVCLGCRFWVHTQCRDKTINNCRQICRPCGDTDPDMEPTHHFVEGNLPSSTLCADCEKPINTKQCLTGYSCRWCNMSVHSACMAKIQGWNLMCTLGDFAPCLLYKTAIIGNEGYTHYDSWVKRHREIDRKLRLPYTGSDSQEHKPIKLYEGPNPRSRFQEFHVDHKVKAFELLNLGLMQHGIDPDVDVRSGQYYLTEMTYKEKVTNAALSPAAAARPPSLSRGFSGGSLFAGASVGLNAITLPPTVPKVEPAKADVERYGKEEAEEIARQQKVSFVGVVNKQVKPKTTVSKMRKKVAKNEKKGVVKTAFFIRSVDHDRIVKEGGLTLKIFVGPDVLGSSAFKFFKATLSDSVENVLVWAKRELRIHQPLEDLYIEEISCVDGTLSRAQLAAKDPVIRGPLAHINRHINENSIRLYIRSSAVQTKQVEQVVAVGGVARSMDVEGMTNFIAGIIDPETWEMMVPATNQGVALIRLSGTNFEVDSMTMQLRQAALSVTNLPTFSTFKPGTVPLLVLINSKSGGGQGVELLVQISQYLSPLQVFDITGVGPICSLLTFRDVPEFRILVCGGDGTVGWILNTLEDLQEHMVCKKPGVAILPVGTGNDLARTLGWGPGWEGEPVVPILTSAVLSQPCMMDRWKITTTQDEGSSSVPACTMTNYFGIGLDAHIALGFHEKREAHPEQFKSRLRNKAHYVQIGTAAMLSHPCKGFGKNIEFEGYVEANNAWQVVDTKGYEGMVCLNIASFGGGAAPWGSKDSKKCTEPSFSDGMVEVFGVTGIVHLSAIGGHTATGTRVGQFTAIRIKVKANTVCQVDGEPYRVGTGNIEIGTLPEQSCMLTLSKQLAQDAKALFRNQPSFRTKKNMKKRRSSVRTATSS